MKKKKDIDLLLLHRRNNNNKNKFRNKMNLKVINQNGKPKVRPLELLLNKEKENS